MQLQGIVFIRLQGNDILVNCQGNTDSFTLRIQYLFTKSVIIRGNYILTRNYIHFKEPYICSVKEIYPRSMKTYSSIQGNMFINVQVQGHILIQGNYIYCTLLHSRNSRN